MPQRAHSEHPIDQVNPIGHDRCVGALNVCSACVLFAAHSHPQTGPHPCSPEDDEHGRRSGPPARLPRPRTSFVGRAAELAPARHLLGHRGTSRPERPCWSSGSGRYGNS
jgi:hypothetical protein